MSRSLCHAVIASRRGAEGSLSSINFAQAKASGFASRFRGQRALKLARFAPRRGLLIYGEMWQFEIAKSYAMHVNEVNAIYDHYAKRGVNNMEIFRRYIYPRFGITVRTFYNYLKVGCVSEIN